MTTVEQVQRSDMPAGLVERLELIDRQFAELRDRRPLLPAATTPPELVDAARSLDAELRRHHGTRVAGSIERWRRSLIDAALAGSLVEPATADQLRTNARHLEDAVEPGQEELMSSYHRFGALLRNVDYTTPERRASLVASTVRRKRRSAQEFGLELELTDEEWLVL